MSLEGQIIYLLITFGFALYMFHQGKRTGLEIGVSTLITHLSSNKIITVSYSEDGDIADIEAYKDADV